ncbi:MAG: IS66 family transposase, partial [Prochloraceae cyanobacterium]
RELQALAIREQKIYLKESPELFRQPTEIFLDIEGNPDTQFYYLIGILACQMNSSEYTAFWANTQQDEEQVWNNFLATITQYPKAPIYHYGNYEVKIITKLAKRYGTVIDHLYKQLINVNHFIYGKVYFPAYSNSLKDIGRSIGAKWTSPKASGIQTLVWRHYWEETADTKYKELLLTYNKEDCQALKLLTDELIKISNSAEKLSDVEFADKHKRPKTEVEKQIHTQLRTVLNFSYLQYDKKKIHFRQEEEKEDSETKKARNRNKRKQLTQKLLDINRRVQKTIEISPQTVCPQCGSLQLRPYDKETHRVIIDLKLTRNGLKKTIIRFTGSYQYCIKCYTLCPPPFKYKQSQIYGHGLKAWIVYHRIALRLPYESISESFQEQFKEKIATGSLSRFIHDLAVYYSETENILIQHLLESPFIHVDETKINIQGENWYVWVFTDIKYTILKLQETREATIIHSLLADYSGILISDFYSGYDSVKCAQQKCWVHLIGDLNNDLWESPFDSELESFVLHVKDLIIPIMECIQKYGLRRRNLRKFEKNVDRFYKNFIIDVNYNSDIVSKYQKRFIRYRESLFTFLKHDGILWHNNPAEWAIRPIAKQRSISSSFSSSIAEAYLILLGIRQTCRSQGKSFFKFLFSGQKNLDLFEVRKQKKNEY